MGDESEYLFAEKYFGGWPHWKRLIACTWFMDYLSSFREELAAKQAGESLNRIKQAAKGGRLDLDKYLLEKGWIDKKAVGRPTKERIKSEAQKIALDHQDISDDFSRILDKTTFQ